MTVIPEISKSLRRLFLLAVPAVLTILSVHAEGPVELEDLLRGTGAVMRWDPWLHTGRLSMGEKSLIFRPGDTWMLSGDGMLEPTGGILEENGVLIFSEDAAVAVRHFFGIEDKGRAPYRLSTILIDPGHGGRDPGAWRIWPVDGLNHPIREKDVTLEISLRLAEELRTTYPDKTILLTRYDDSYPSLEDRVAMANGFDLAPREGMIYISIHANASLNPGAEGYEVWYLPEDYRRTLVNPANLGSDSEVIAPIVNILWEEEFTHESIRLADMILSGFSRTLGDRVPNRGRREESWFVVRNARMASVLVEVGFLTHAGEAARLRDPAYLKRISQGLYTGVVDFITYFESREEIP